MAHQLEARMADPVLDVLLPPGEEIVDADDIVPVRHQAVAQMRAEKAGAAGDEDGFSIKHVFQPATDDHERRQAVSPCANVGDGAMNAG